MTETEPVLLANAINLHSEILDEDRTFVMRVPPKVKNAADTPVDVTVIYILDAEKHFASAAASAAFFEASRISSLGPAVVVGVVSTDRTRDFTPSASNAKRDGTIDVKAVPVGGDADKFLRFLTTELREAAENRLPSGVRIARRMLIGHSFGGLFTLHALLTQPQAFDAYAALDPSLWWDQGKLAHAAALKGVPTAKDMTHPPVLYAAFAAKPRKENVVHRSEAQRFSEETATTLTHQGIAAHVRFFPDEVHGTVAPPAIFDALKVLFPAQKPAP
ncbi:MAG: alpha/beta hydrolase-fold protein [Sutterellaceae bacterium]|nr:alpha/beta hydrolase-fold protein [Sutterellaceae bacterium]